MNQNEFATLKTQRKVQTVKSEPKQRSDRSTTTPLAPDMASYLAVLELLQRPRRPTETAPAFTPKNFAEQVQFYENGTTRRLYVYINNSWRYVTLT